MTKEDIDILLAGRKAVDAYRSVAADYREADSLSKETLTSANVVTAKEKYLDREVATKKMHDGLFKLGFGKAADTSAYDDFRIFNDKMVLEEYKGMVTITFLGCKDCPTKRCIELYGKDACVSLNITTAGDSMYLFFLRLRKKSVTGKPTNFADVKVCPDGYGFQWKRNRDEQFDLEWE